MHYKTNRQNHDFQIAYFIAGSCHTPDAAYAILCDLREDRSNALKLCESSMLREKAKRIRAEKRLASEDEADRLEAQADLSEIAALEETVQRNITAAQAEVATIQKCMDALEPLRKYAHLPLAEAHQAAQCEEWELELITRAENYVITQGTIPADHFATMRMHPHFRTKIAPALANVRELMRTGEKQQLMELTCKRRLFDLPQALGLPPAPATPTLPQE